MGDPAISHPDLPRIGPIEQVAPSAPPRRLVVALMGLPGAGKSIVARAIENQLGLRRVCRDAIRQALFPRCAYTFLEKRAAFRAVSLAVEINCMIGESSVIDGMTFSRRDDLERIVEIANRCNFLPLPLLLDCPPAIARQRVARDLANDIHLARDRTPEMVDAVFARADPPPPGVLRIDATLSAPEVCRIAIAAVSARMGLAAVG